MILTVRLAHLCEPHSLFIKFTLFVDFSEGEVYNGTILLLRRQSNMKRFLSIFMCLALVLSLGAILASCDDSAEPAATTAATTVATTTAEDTTTAATTTAATTTAATTATTAPAPEGCELYVKDGIVFAYPDDWNKDASTGIISAPNGQKNIVVTYEDATTMYDNLSADQFYAMFAPMYAQLGWTISNVSARTATTNGLSVNVYSFETTLPQASAPMIQTLFTVTVGSRTYSIALSENSVDEALANTIIDTLRAE